MRGTTKLFVQIGNGELRPVNAPEEVIQSVICLPELDVKHYRNIPKCAKRRVLEALVGAGMALSYKQLLALTGYSIAYLYSIISALVYENKVIGERRGGKIYRYRIAQSAKVTTCRRMKRKAALPPELTTLGNGDGNSPEKIAQQAARKVLRLVVKADTAIDEEMLLSTRLYSRWYFQKAIRVLVAGGYLSTKTIRGVRYYKPTAKARRLAPLL